jgi:hypothetical protein
VQNAATVSLSANAQIILDALEMDSPLSTRQVKESTGLGGKFNEGAYNRAMKELFSRFLIVGFGEVDDGAFPSLAVGATKSIYEDIWRASQALPVIKAEEIIDKYWPEGTKMRIYFNKIRSKIASK